MEMKTRDKDLISWQNMVWTDENFPSFLYIDPSDCYPLRMSRVT